jgi:hypothetical protein
MMKFIQLTQHISTEEAESIITFLDELSAILVANYGEEINKSHRTQLGFTERNREKEESSDDL